MKTVTRLLGLAAMVVLFAGCASAPLAGNGQPPTMNLEAEPYRIGVGDSLSIHVWRNPELSHSIIVRPDGAISMPLMGDVSAENKKPEDLAAEIRVALGELIRNPEVTVMVTNPVSKEFRDRVRITGQVGSQLSINHRSGMTVLDLVLQAGGVTDFAAPKRAQLHRLTAGGYTSYRLDLDSILNDGNMSSNFLLQPGDVITVPRKQLFRGEF